MTASFFPSSARKLLPVLFGTVFAAAGIYALVQPPFDAIPDLADTQVFVVYTEEPGQASQVTEDRGVSAQTTAMPTLSKSKTVYGFSLFGVSFIYAGSEDGPPSATSLIDHESNLDAPLKSSAEASPPQAEASQISANEMKDMGGRR